MRGWREKVKTNDALRFAKRHLNKHLKKNAEDRQTTVLKVHAESGFRPPDMDRAHDQEIKVFGRIWRLTHSIEQRVDYDTWQMTLVFTSKFRNNLSAMRASVDNAR